MRKTKIKRENDSIPMVGSHTFLIDSARLQYKFTLTRKINLVAGESATGKTTLFRLVNAILGSSNNEAGTIISDIDVLTIVPSDFAKNGYKSKLRDNSNCLFIIDEGFGGLRTEDFCREVRDSNNYFLLIVRGPFEMLSYSPDSVYVMASDEKNRNYWLEPKYPEFKDHYAPDKLVIEDSKAGYKFFKSLCNNKANVCVTAEGNSNVYAVMKNNMEPGKRVLAVVDKAGFGPYMDLFDNLNEWSGGYLFLYESFEWLLLKSKLFEKDKEVQAILKEPHNYISALDYSWERYFTNLLKDKTKYTPAAYTKSSLSCCYTEDCCCRKGPCELMIKGNKIDSILTGVFDNIDFSKVRANADKINDSECTKMSLQ